MKVISSGNEGKTKGESNIKWRTVNCPGCDEQLRLWWGARSRKVKQFVCRYCRTLFWMDRGGIMQGDMWVLSKAELGRLRSYGLDMKESQGP